MTLCPSGIKNEEVGSSVGIKIQDDKISSFCSRQGGSLLLEADETDIHKEMMVPFSYASPEAFFGHR